MNRPNIVYLHSHDTGRYVQPYGYSVSTPSLQRFAQQGVLFRQAFCSAPTCSPSRAGLLTGQSPHSAGMLGLAHRGFALKDRKQHLAHTLKAAGYRTALVGFQHVAGDGDWASLGYDEPYARQPAVLADWLAQRDVDQPFFLDVGFTLTHRSGSHHGRKPYHNGVESPLGDPRYLRPPAPLPDTPASREDFADYAVAANRLDDLMGSVIDQIDAHGLGDDTLIIVTTDHGIAFPGMKCSLTDHGMGVMLIMRGPGGFLGGRVVDGMVSHIDLFPTLCELLEIDPPKWLQGKSMLPLVRGESPQIHEAVFGEVTYHAAYEPKRACRTPRFKYIREFSDHGRPVLPNCDDSVSKTQWLEAGWRDRPVAEEQLYDLMFDPNEACSVAADPRYTSPLLDMQRRLLTWMTETNDPLLHGPVPLPAGGKANDVDGLSPTEPPR